MTLGPQRRPTGSCSSSCSPTSDRASSRLRGFGGRSPPSSCPGGRRRPGPDDRRASHAREPDSSWESSRCDSPRGSLPFRVDTDGSPNHTREPPRPRPPRGRRPAEFGRHTSPHERTCHSRSGRDVLPERVTNRSRLPGPAESPLQREWAGFQSCRACGTDVGPGHLGTRPYGGIDPRRFNLAEPRGRTRLAGENGTRQVSFKSDNGRIVDTTR